jgi:hypothetical protein
VQFRLRSFPHPHYTVSFINAPLLSIHAKSVFGGREMPRFDSVLIRTLAHGCWWF